MLYLIVLLILFLFIVTYICNTCAALHLIVQHMAEKVCTECDGPPDSLYWMWWASWIVSNAYIYHHCIVAFQWLLVHWFVSCFLHFWWLFSSLCTATTHPTCVTACSLGGSFFWTSLLCLILCIIMLFIIVVYIGYLLTFGSKPSICLLNSIVVGLGRPQVSWTLIW